MQRSVFNAARIVDEYANGPFEARWPLRDREKGRDDEGAMSTADTALSISIKMAPGPEHRQEPVAPDKIAESDRAADADTNADAAAAADVVIDIENIDAALAATGSGNSNNNNDKNNDDDDDHPVAVAVIAAEQSSNIEIAPANFAAGAADSISQSSPPNSGADSKQVSIAATASRKHRHSRRRGSCLLFLQFLKFVARTLYNEKHAG